MDAAHTVADSWRMGNVHLQILPHKSVLLQRYVQQNVSTAASRRKDKQKKGRFPFVTPPCAFHLFILRVSEHVLAAFSRTGHEIWYTEAFRGGWLAEKSHTNIGD